MKKYMQMFKFKLEKRKRSMKKANISPSVSLHGCSTELSWWALHQSQTSSAMWCCLSGSNGVAGAGSEVTPVPSGCFAVLDGTVIGAADDGRAICGPSRGAFRPRKKGGCHYPKV